MDMSVSGGNKNQEVKFDGICHLFKQEPRRCLVRRVKQLNLLIGQLPRYAATDAATVRNMACRALYFLRSNYNQQI